MNYKYAIILASLLFGYANAMELDPDEEREGGIKAHNVYLSSEICGGVKPLSNLTAQFLARKLTIDRNVSDIKEHFNLEKLNEPTRLLVYEALTKNQNNFLWKNSPYRVSQQHLGVQIRNILILNNDQLLVLYDEKFDESKFSVIKVWDIEKNDWIDFDFALPNIYVKNWLLSKDLKTLFLLCKPNKIIVYDLVNNEVISITESANFITSFCLINNDKFVCCALGTKREVQIFDKENSECIASFQTADDVDLIDSIDDFIVTKSESRLTSWKFMYGKDSKYKCVKVSDTQLVNKSQNDIDDFKLSSDGKTILMCCNFGFGCPKRLFLTFPNFRFIKKYHSCSELHNGLGKDIFIKNEMTYNLIPPGYTYKFFCLKNYRTGKIVKRFDFSKDAPSLALYNNPLYVQKFSISQDNMFIIVYHRNGYIAKLSLDIDEYLKSILEEKENVAKSRWFDFLKI